MNACNTNGKYHVARPISNKTEILHTTHTHGIPGKPVELHPCFTSKSSATQELHYNHVYAYNMVYNPGIPSLLNSPESGVEV
jgi:hypothetical protein